MAIWMRLLFLVSFVSVTSQALAFQIKNVHTDGVKPSKVRIVVDPEESGNAGELDLLLLIDDSGSMGFYQQLLSANIPNLVAKLSQIPSVHVGVMTSSTQARPSGVLIGTPNVLTSDMIRFYDLLKERVNVGIKGDGEEQFFAPIITGLSSPILETANQNFLRPNAHLAVVMITDAEDHSTVTPEQFVDFLRNLKGEGGFSLSGFVVSQPRSDCSSDDGLAEVKLSQAIQLAKGNEFNLCAGNFSEAIQNTGGTISRKVERTIQLPYKPNSSTLRVTYGKVVLTAGDQQNGWIYNSVSNSLIIGDGVDFNSLPPAQLVIEFEKQ